LVPRRHLYQFEPYLLAEVDDLQESEWC
jgi:hypothetical protein